MPRFSSLSSNVQTLLFTLLTAGVAYLVFYPIFTLVVTSIEVHFYGQETKYGVDNWSELFVQERLGDAISNTVSLSATRQFFSLLIGIFIAWLIARTDLPGRKYIEIGFWIALYMPILPVTLSWVLLLGGNGALVNQYLIEWGLISEPIFNLYSWWGIIWVHLMTATLAVKVFLLVPAFRSLDSSLEEAARASGVSPFGTLRRIVVPIMMPTILVVMLLGMVRSMQGFEVELILGTPAGIDVYSTIIYRAMTQEPPLYGLSSALALTFLLTLAPFVILQQWYAHKRSFASVSGKFSNRVQELGIYRWPLFWVVISLVLLMTLVPFVFLTMATFMKLFGIFDMPDPWTYQNWQDAIASGNIVNSFFNTLKLGVSASIIGMILFTTIAYVAAKTNYSGRKALDFLTWLPALIPGIVLSLALLEVFTRSPIFRPFYGTLVVMVVAIVIASMTTGSQIIRSALGRLSNELEEAAWAAGGGRLYTIRRVVLPLIAPSIAVIGLDVFAHATAAVGAIALLATGSTQPLSILQLDFLNAGNFEAGAVVGLLIMILTVICALLARYIGLRAGIGASH
jgi:iron(III) transport system permease protein